MIRAGTSGWSYREWTGVLYPKGTTSGEYLKLYADEFTTVEVNNSFYRFPRGEMFAPWVDKTPRDFLFAVKLWRGLVHGAQVKPRWVRDFFDAVGVLGKKLGPILIQLPPQRPANPEWLDTLLSALPKQYQYAVELRDPRWLVDPVYDVLRHHNAANCYYDFKGFSNPEVSTADFHYIRLHGPHAQPYKGHYSDDRLKHYAHLRKSGFIYFDNTMNGAAIQDLRKLLDLAGQGRHNKAA